MKKIAVLLVDLSFLLFASSSLAAKEIQCLHKGPEKYWINKISIDTEARTVDIDEGPYQARVAVIHAHLAYADEMKLNGYPALAFDAPAGDRPNQRHLFKLFHALDEWTLIDVGVLYVDGQPTLLALGKSSAFDCHGAWP